MEKTLLREVQTLLHIPQAENESSAADIREVEVGRQLLN